MGLEEQIQQQAQQQAQQVHDENATADQFAVSQTPFHTHNGADSQRVNFNDLVQRSEFVECFLLGSSAATAANYGVFWIAPYKCTFLGATEVHAVLGTDGSAVTLQVEKLTGTTATGSGTNLLASGFNLKATINTVQTAKLAASATTTFNLAKGDRLGLSLTGTPTSVSQVVVVCQLMY